MTKEAAIAAAAAALAAGAYHANAEPADSSKPDGPWRVSVQRTPATTRDAK